jgi:hypothetical protein
MRTLCYNYNTTVLYNVTLTFTFTVVSALLQAISWLSIALWPAVSLPILTMFLLLSNFGASICEVVNDAIVAEAGKQATSSSGSGQLQSFAWIFGSSAGALGNLLGGIALSYFSPRVSFCFLRSFSFSSSSLLWLYLRLLSNSQTQLLIYQPSPVSVCKSKSYRVPYVCLKCFGQSYGSQCHMPSYHFYLGPCSSIRLKC